MKIEILKEPHGAGVLHCTRTDGTLTWQRRAKHAEHFALHDLTHYAVETVLGYGRGFFGLIAEGWELDDTTGKGQRGGLPAEAIEVERIVGLFDTERASCVLWACEEFNLYAPRTLTEDEIQKVRTARGVVFRQWFAIAAGDKLELTFVASVPALPLTGIGNRRSG